MNLSVLLLVAICKVTTAARILAFFPMAIKSQHNIFRPIAVELARRGHDVTFLTPIPAKNPPANLKQIIIADNLNFLTEGREYDADKSFPMLTYEWTKVGYGLGEIVYSDKLVQELIHSRQHFDAVLSESMVLQEANAALAHKFNALAIEINALVDSAWVNENAGLPDNPSFMVDFKSPYTDDMSYTQRIHNFYVTSSSIMMNYVGVMKQQELVDKYFNYEGSETRPPLHKLLSNKSLILLNTHHSIGFSYPRAPHVKEIGGINIQPSKKLPADLAAFMDGAKHGVIYFSFGSMINVSDVFSTAKLNGLMDLFGNLRQRVLFKWETERKSNFPSNVMTSMWFPQTDVLAHKNTKIFVSHGGLLSTTEAINYAVPVISVPFNYDQIKNAAFIVSNGCGLSLQLANVSGASLDWAINEILKNPMYAKQIGKRSELFKDRPRPPLEEAMYWIEYVLKHKNVLQPRSTQLTFIQLHMLDVYFTITLIFACIYILICKLFKYFIHLLFGKPTKPANLKKKSD